MNWLDILILVMLAWNIWTGLKTGLVAGLARLAGIFLGFGAAMNLHGTLADTVELKWKFSSTIGGLLPITGKAVPSTTDLIYPLKSLPQSQLTVSAPAQGLQALTEPVTRAFSLGILDILCFIVIFIVVSRVVVMLGYLLGKAARIMLLGPIDRFGGVLLGAARGGLLVLVLVALIRSIQLPATYLSGGQGSSWINLAFNKSLLIPYFLNTLGAFNLKFPGWGI